MVFSASIYIIAARLKTHFTPKTANLSGTTAEAAYYLTVTPYQVPESTSAFFIPAKLWRLLSSGVPAPRQCVSRLTA